MVFKMLYFYKINALTLSTILSHIKPVQQYGRLKLVTMEMEKLYQDTVIFKTLRNTSIISKLHPYFVGKLVSRVEYSCT